MSQPVTTAVIGGSGLFDLADFDAERELHIETSYGPPSDAITIGTWGQHRVAFLLRHGRGHRLLPSEIPYRANIYALKSIGVERLIAVSAVGSMQPQIEPRDLLLPDQFVDNTHQRVSTYFGNGIVGHINLTQPVCPELIDLLRTASQSQNLRVHPAGIYQCEEGPQFPTQAEAELYRARSNVSVIGMTLATEMKLAREAEMCYAAICTVTDFAPWYLGEELNTEVVAANSKKMQPSVQKILVDVIAHIPNARHCDCAHTLDGAIQTDRAAITPEARDRLKWLIGDR